MRLYLTAETSIPDLYIDYIEVLLKSGEEVSLLKRAKLNYLERECEEPHESLDSLDEDQLPATEDAYMQTLFSDDPFGFTEDRLAKAFSELPLMRQQILKLLFVDEMKPRDIAKILNCSAQYVSNQKQKGLKYLRKTIVEGGDIDG